MALIYLREREMPRSKPKPDVRELLTVFDTNALWTQNPGDLINADMRTLVTSNSAHADLKISWHLPEPVVRERHYQMKGKGRRIHRGPGWNEGWDCAAYERPCD